MVEGYYRGLPSISWGRIQYTERRAALTGESMGETREYIEKIANELEEEGVVVDPGVIQDRVAEEIPDYATDN